MLTLIEVWAHLNRRHTQHFTSYRPTKSYYRVEKHTEILDIIYTQMQHLTGGKIRKGECLTPAVTFPLLYCSVCTTCGMFWNHVLVGRI